MPLALSPAEQKHTARGCKVGLPLHAIMFEAALNHSAYAADEILTL